MAKQEAESRFDFVPSPEILYLESPEQLQDREIFVYRVHDPEPMFARQVVERLWGIAGEVNPGTEMPIKFYRRMPHGIKSDSVHDEFNISLAVPIENQLAEALGICQGLAFIDRKNSDLPWNLVVESPVIASSEGDASHFLLIDLDGKVNSLDQFVIENSFKAAGFSGFLLVSGASYHYWSDFTVSADSLPAFLGTAAAALTPQVSDNDRLLSIAFRMSVCQNLAEGQELASQILNRNSALFIPSSGSGFKSGSFFDFRWACHRLLAGKLALRVSSDRYPQEPILISELTARSFS
ncbi:MAG TPA: hypothetical protein VMW41_03205 [Candidatus Bathyarchaeia archaeon]|nr:hypothetical protein [Candidatus Bathyarchaeia archaeon]